MAKKQQAAADNETRFLNIRRGLIIATVASIALVALLWGAIQLESFLIADPQFTLASPPDPGEDSPAVEVTGVNHSARNNVSATFDRDYGRSIYLMPLRQRREELLRFPWIKDARVTRVWPNRLQIRVTEREPVAFVRLPNETELPLIDADGFILRPETQESLNLPILTGIDRKQTGDERRVRVRRLQKLVADAGELSAKISEVDATDPDNLKIMQDAGGKAVTLIIGSRYYKRRLEKFKQNAEDLLRRDPSKTVFDLRVDGSIYARPAQPTLTAEGVRTSD
ncbi:MAG: FtsQ-type POTRA domain-containing protein [Bryobacterales bacterium]|nr:FtsQ-type POTRA domain-containing protein [Bryobacterales bacterium]